ncbi:hypothetical protein Bbelb_249170 [Branchiostoma belcheri]|nr:hypothetical protein Bbelb_249170 [Branchiostoma belcheri]
MALLDFETKASVTTRRTCFWVLSTCKNVGKRRASVRGEYHLRTESYGFGSTQTRLRTLSACKTFFYVRSADSPAVRASTSDARAPNVPCGRSTCEYGLLTVVLSGGKTTLLLRARWRVTVLGQGRTRRLKFVFYKTSYVRLGSPCDPDPADWTRPDQTSCLEEPRTRQQHPQVRLDGQLSSREETCDDGQLLSRADKMRAQQAD